MLPSQCWFSQLSLEGPIQNSREEGIEFVGGFNLEIFQGILYGIQDYPVPSQFHSVETLIVLAQGVFSRSPQINVFLCTLRGNLFQVPSQVFKVMVKNSD